MEASPRLAQLIRDRKERIIARWKERVRARPIAGGLPEPYLTDSIPDLLDQLAVAVESGKEPDHPHLVGEATAHARQRLGLGYDVGQVVVEYMDMRAALQDELAADGAELTIGAWCSMSSVLDATVRQMMDRFSRAREQKLRAFERISAEPLTAPNLEALLERVIDVFADVAPEVDTVTILLRDGDALRVRASRGLEEEIHRGFSLAIGEGFAGKIAATRHPVLLHDARHDPLVKSDVVRARGVRALYGVPLIDPGGELLGVAHMGSTVAGEFQDEDLILFNGLANRATALIGSRATTDRLLRDEHQRERFIGVLGHDLRAPLTAVIGSAQLLLARGKLDEHDRRVVERIARAGDRMARLISDVLDFVRARMGPGMPLAPSWVDLEDVVRSTAEEAEIGHPGRAVGVTARLRSRVWCDADRVAQLVANLVGNALEHGTPDAPVDVVLDEHGTDAVICVHNEGPAIPRELLPHVFEPFRRGAEGRVPGVGLGLFIAQAIAIAHGGSIEVRSEAGRGTTFTVRLPREPASAPPSRADRVDRAE